MLQLLVSPLIFAIPAIGRLQEKDKNSSLLKKDECDDCRDDDDISLPSLGGLSISSELSDMTFDEQSIAEICHMLGAKVSQDKADHTFPPNFVRPKNFENSMECDLPVGYYRLRRAFLSEGNEFWNQRLLQHVLQYENVHCTGWDHDKECIGSPVLPNHIKSKDIIGATRKTEYLMPKTMFVKANMAYETATITEYSDHCFAIEMATTNPHVPFGKKFIAHTKIVVYNQGDNTCQMECSVETEFPKGPPMGLGKQIKNAMKAGSMEVFEKMCHAIKNCDANDGGWV
mmetsp:Transcript_24394/g.27887  ORF Transcript_24394/g.27887 Transcript_24394/m.27887 type:complete len:286 (-) Transcript_24394:307-1164(-)